MADDPALIADTVRGRARCNHGLVSWADEPNPCDLCAAQRYGYGRSLLPRFVRSAAVSGALVGAEPLQPLSCGDAPAHDRFVGEPVHGDLPPGDRLSAVAADGGVHVSQYEASAPRAVDGQTTHSDGQDS